MTFSFFHDEKNNKLQSKGLDLLSGNTLNLDGKDVPILSGEVQFFRMDPSVWEPCLEQVKNLGLPIVSTYLSWQRFSKGPDQYDLTGESDPRLNVPLFLDLCKKYGLYVTMKPGPWICAEETNGGYPGWLVEQPALQVLDAQNQPVKGYNPPFQSPIPSYFHPDYQYHVQRWLEEVDRVIKLYCYPDGPIILIQLDNEPCFTFHDRLFESDYNPVIADKGGLYSRWLEKKYKKISELNKQYGSNWTTFSEIVPPRKLELHHDPELSQYFDWVEFKEYLLASHVASIGKDHLQNGIDQVLFTINYNQHPQLAEPNNWHLLECASGMGGYDYYPNLPVDIQNFNDVVQAVNYSRAVNRVPWSPEIMCGIWSFAGSEHSSHHLPSNEYEFLYLICLAYGLKGMNFYMLADRDNWVNSPINDRGELTETADAVRHTVQIMKSIPSFFELEEEQDVGVLYYRQYAREAFIAQESPTQIAGKSLGKGYDYFKGIYQELLEININPGIYDPDIHPSELPGYATLFAGLCQHMDAHTQSKLLEYIKAGGCLVCLPELPVMDWQNSPKTILQEAWDVSTDKQVYDGYSVTNIEKGTMIVFSDIRPGVTQIQELIKNYSNQPGLTASDPRIRTTLQRSQKDLVYYVINTSNETIKTKLISKNSRKGFLVDVLSGEQVEISEGTLKVEVQPRSVRVFRKIED